MAQLRVGFEPKRFGGVLGLPYVPSPRAINIAFFVALLASVLMLGPALAHALELPTKIGLPRDEYFIVQKIYRGWSLVSLLLGVQFVSLTIAAYLVRAERHVLALTLLAIVCVMAAQGLFWAFTYPANVATANWTVPPANWTELRLRWEYSHAAGAALQLLGLCLLFAAVLVRGRRYARRDYYYY